MEPLLIHADPGARAGFVAAWLNDQLTELKFDIGKDLRLQYYKIHQLENPKFPKEIKKFPGIKLRIQPTVESIDLISLLHLRKNIHAYQLEFTKDEYCLDTFTELAQFGQGILQEDKQLDYLLYDYVIKFSDTFDVDFMVDLYKKIVGVNPDQSMVDMLIKTNDLNCISIDKNHACSILKLILKKEHELGLKEENRFWSIVDIYKSTPIENLYDTVSNIIISDNYGTVL